MFSKYLINVFSNHNISITKHLESMFNHDIDNYILLDNNGLSKVREKDLHLKETNEKNNWSNLP